MSLFNRIFGEPEIRALDPHNKAEVKKMIEELVVIGRTDDFLSRSQTNRRKAKPDRRNTIDDGSSADDQIQTQGRPGRAS